jgi:hypothetical protein
MDPALRDRKIHSLPWAPGSSGPADKGGDQHAVESTSPASVATAGSWGGVVMDDDILREL